MVQRVTDLPGMAVEAGEYRHLTVGGDTSCGDAADHGVNFFVTAHRTLKRRVHSRRTFEAGGSGGNMHSSLCMQRIDQNHHERC